MKLKRISYQLGLYIMSLFIVSCGSVRDGGGGNMNIGIIQDAIPRVEPKSSQGNPQFYDIRGKRYFVMSSSLGYKEKGIASWYGKKFHGRLTSNGETYNMYTMTAAHKTLPLPTYVQVTNLENGRKITVRVNDRGPFHDNRIIDLSYAAALKLNIVKQGTAMVEVRAIDTKNPRRTLNAGVRSVNQSSLAGSTNSVNISNQIFIQMGAFSEKANAERLVRLLISHHFNNVEIVPASAGNRVLHKVRIGPLYTIAVADITTERLKTLGYDEFKIVID